MDETTHLRRNFHIGCTSPIVLIFAPVHGRTLFTLHHPASPSVVCAYSLSSGALLKAVPCRDMNRDTPVEFQFVAHIGGFLTEQSVCVGNTTFALDDSQTYLLTQRDTLSHQLLWRSPPYKLRADGVLLDEHTQCSMQTRHLLEWLRSKREHIQ